MTGFLSRDAIFAVNDYKVEVVEVPEWGGQVKVKGLTGRERDEFEAGMFVRRGREMVRDTANLRARLVVLCALDEAGNPLFQRDDIKALGEKSGAALDRLYEAAAKLSGIMDSDLEDKIEDFGEAPGSSSSTDSARSSDEARKNSSASSTPKS
jgi:hypothetical protein